MSQTTARKNGRRKYTTFLEFFLGDRTTNVKQTLSYESQIWLIFCCFTGLLPSLLVGHHCWTFLRVIQGNFKTFMEKRCLQWKAMQEFKNIFWTKVRPTLNSVFLEGIEVVWHVTMNHPGVESPLLFMLNQVHFTLSFHGLSSENVIEQCPRQTELVNCWILGPWEHRLPFLTSAVLSPFETHFCCPSVPMAFLRIDYNFCLTFKPTVGTMNLLPSSPFTMVIGLWRAWIYIHFLFFPL